MAIHPYGKKKITVICSHCGEEWESYSLQKGVEEGSLIHTICENCLEVSLREFYTYKRYNIIIDEHRGYYRINVESPEGETIETFLGIHEEDLEDVKLEAEKLVDNQ